MNLIVKFGDKIIFKDDGKWLHPLFKLEKFLEKEEYDAEKLYLEDKVIGRGAAFLIAKMGFKRCHGRILSRKSIPVLERFGIEYTRDRVVNSIQCKTERELKADFSLEKAYSILSKRAGRDG